MYILRLLPIITALIYASNALSQVTPSDAIEKVYIQTDKPMYLQGDRIWYNLTAYNANNLPALLSDRVQIQLKKPDGTSLYNKEYTLINGQVSESILIPKNVPGGIYTFVASTGWMTAAGVANVYKKEIYIQKYIAPRILMKIDLDRDSYGLNDEVVGTFSATDLKDNPLQNTEVQYAIIANGQETSRLYTTTNIQGVAILRATVPEHLESENVSLTAKITYKSQIESVRKTVPVLSDNIDIQFLPEGGFLLADHSNKVAFKALASNGKPADVEGDIVDGRGSRIGGFVSVHDGMGALDFYPEADQQYFAKLCKPYASDRLIPIGHVRSSGCKIEVKQSDDELHVAVLGELNEDLFLSISDVAEVKWQSHKVKTDNTIDISGLAMGIHKLILTSESDTLSERLVFLHPDIRLNVDIQVDQAEYGLRKTVNATIRTTDSNGRPVPTQVCISAAEDKMLSHADDKQATIVSELLLSSELRGDIHEPNYYFDSINHQTVAALDLVMLTNGWRSHYDNIPMTAAINYYRSLHTYIGRIVAKGRDSSPKTKIYVTDFARKTAYNVHTDDDGFFSITRSDNDHVTLVANLNSRQYQIMEVNMKSLQKQNPSKYKNVSSALNNKGMVGNIVQNEIEGTPELVRTSIEEGVLFNCVEIVEYAVPLIEMDYTTSGATVTAEAIRSLPTKSITAIAASTAAISSNLDEISIRGSRSNSTDYYVDGVRVSGLIPQAMLSEEAEMHFDNEIGLELPYFRNVNNKGNTTNQIITHYVPKKRIILPAKTKFYVAKYAADEVVQKRTDYRQTLYWNPIVQTNTLGEATISFSTSDEVTSFSIIAEGASATGQIGRGLGKVIVTKPLSTDCKVPPYFVIGDTSTLRIVVDNDSDQDQNLQLKIANTGDLNVTLIGTSKYLLEAKSSHVFYAQVIATGRNYGHLDIKITSEVDSDYISQHFEIFSPYFPLHLSVAGNDADTFRHTLSAPIASSIRVDYKTFDPISSALDGIESMLRSPGGCFEQVSSSTYPNVMVLQYLQRHQSSNTKIQEKALTYIRDGYKRLVDYETSVDGFDWWGKAPGHVGLTAFGLLEFSDMAKVYDGVDPAMIKRTVDYLMRNRDGKGGFVLGKGYDGFGSALYDVQTAYVLYAISEQKTHKVSVDREYSTAKKHATKTEDPYVTALMAMTAHNNGLTDDYAAFMQILEDKLSVQNLGSITPDATITRSGDIDSNTETIALCALAMMKSKRSDIQKVTKLIDHLATRRMRGRFGSTQATCLAIQTILRYAELQGAKSAEGQVFASLNGSPIAADTLGSESDLSQFITSDDVQFVTTYIGDSPLNYVLDIAYESALPPSAAKHSLDLNVALTQSHCTLANMVGLDVQMTNTKAYPLANPTLVIGIPSGLSLDHKQLKELKEDGAFDYFEMFANRLIIYYNEVSAREEQRFLLDLKAEICGNYTAPPSSAYLYYDEADIVWQKGSEIEVSCVADD